MAKITRWIQKSGHFGLFPGLLFSVQKSEWAVNDRKSYLSYLSTYSKKQNENSLKIDNPRADTIKVSTNK